MKYQPNNTGPASRQEASAASAQLKRITEAAQQLMSIGCKAAIAEGQFRDDWLKAVEEMREALSPATVAQPVAWEDGAEKYLADISSRSPEPLRQLGDWLATHLDEDEWKTAERFVLGAMESIAQPCASQGCGGAVAIADRVVRLVGEMDDRTSPEDWPEAMLVTGEELHAFILLAFETEAEAALSTAPEQSAKGLTMGGEDAK